MKTNILGLALAVALSSSAPLTATPHVSVEDYLDDALLPQLSSVSALERETHLFATSDVDAARAATVRREPIAMNASAAIDFMEGEARVGPRTTLADPAGASIEFLVYDPSFGEPLNSANGLEGSRLRSAAPEPTVSFLAVLAGALVFVTRTRRFS